MKIEETSGSFLTFFRTLSKTFRLWQLTPGKAQHKQDVAETVFKGKHGVWDPMPKSTYTSPCVASGVDSNTCIIGNPMPESDLNSIPESSLYPSQGLRIWPQAAGIAYA